MSSVVCEKICPFRNGIYCKKDFVMLNQLGQCNEHWNKMGQPIRMRDITVENEVKNKEKPEKVFEDKNENRETEGKNTEEEVKEMEC